MQRRFCLLFLLIMSAFLIAGCKSDKPRANLLDNPDVYKNKNYIDLEVIIFGSDQNTLAEGNYTFDQLNFENGKDGEKNIEVSALVREVVNGNSEVGLLGYGLSDANAIIKQRGQSARLADQKSYEIDLVKSAGLLYGHEIINLNKHSSDITKVINKLSFDLFKKTEGLLSLDTNFVNLRIKDLNELTPSWKDYGLFVQVEEIDDDYFEKRNLDSRGYLYKVINFEFYRHEDVLMMEDNPQFNKKSFEEIIEIKGDSDHSLLLKVIDNINNPLVPIDSTIDTYFHRDNYLTWLATNILLGNADSASGNYYLYSSLEENRFFYIPWDYDKSLTAYSDSASWKKGISNYWGNQLHKRFLMNDRNRDALTAKIEDLYNNVFTPANINELTKSYLPVIENALNKLPDKTDSNTYVNALNSINRFNEIIAHNREEYYNTLKEPMPFFIGTVENLGSYISINWSDSYDFQQQDLTYSIKIATDPLITDVIYEETDIKESEWIIDPLPLGTYYITMTVKDSAGYSQSSFDYYVDPITKLYYQNVKRFIIQ